MYKVFGANITAFHTANILLHSLCAVSTYFILKILLKEFNPTGAIITSAFAALFFATYPLHIEAVSWTAAQMDTFCTLFYLLAVLCFLVSFERSENEKKLFTALALVSTICSFLSKENGVTIPIVLATYYAILKCDKTFVERIKTALTSTWPFWLCLIVYFVMRTVALGTPIGGYYGILEEGFDNILWKWQNGHGFWLFVFPLNRELIPFPHPLYYALASLYILAGALYITSKEQGQEEPSLKKLSLFLLVWSMLCLMVGLVRWMIEPTLAGSRFAYLVTAPLLMLLAIFIVNPIRKHIIVPALLCITFTAISMINCNAWIQASNTVNSIRNSITKTLEEIPKDKRLVILNLPSQVLGVHLFYHWNHLKCSIAPPITTSDLRERIDTPNRFIFLSNRFISKSRLKDLSGSSEFYSYDKKTAKLKHLQLDHLENGLVSSSLLGLESNKTARERFKFKSLDPALLKQADFVELNLKCSNEKNISPAPSKHFALALNWQTTNNSQEEPIYLKLFDDGKWHTYHFPVSECVRWLASKHSGLVWFSGSGHLQYTLGKAKLIDESSLVPKLKFASSAKREVQLFILPEKAPCLVSYDASLLDDVDHVLIEISQPSDIFQTQGTSLRESSDKNSKVMKRLTFKDLKNKVSIERKNFPKAASYQLRLSARSKNGERIGYYSDPVDILLSPAIW